jgi:hypothetical protein
VSKIEWGSPTCVRKREVKEALLWRDVLGNKRGRMAHGEGEVEM